MRQGLLVRLDDITPDMDWNRFYQLKEIFDQYQIKPLLGIVPENRDPKLHKMDERPEFWQEMIALQKDGWTLAIHGLYHTYVNHEGGILKLNKNSEYAGLSYEEQKEKLELGLKILKEHGIFVKYFMAPSHSYDQNTIKALKAVGICYVTDGYGKIPYEYKGVGFIPCTLAKYADRAGIDTICIHANTMTDGMLQQFQKDCVKHSDRFISWSQAEEEIDRKTFGISVLEQKELWIRRFKAFVSHSKAFETYMIKTNDKNRYIKLIKRAVLFPITFIKALLES